MISELAGALIDIGYTVPGQAWTYWNKGPNKGPGPGEDYLDTEEGHKWSHTAAKAAASNLAAVAKALRAKLVPAPPSD